MEHLPGRLHEVDRARQGLSEGTVRVSDIDWSKLGLSAQEMKLVKTHFSQPELEQLRQAFDRIDMDGSGEISSDELTLLFHRSGLEQREVDQLMSNMDADGSGGVDFGEFIAFMAKGIDIFVKEQAQAKAKQTNVLAVNSMQNASRLYRTLYTLFQVEQVKSPFRVDKFGVTLVCYGPIGALIALCLPTVRKTVERYVFIPPPYTNFNEMQIGLSRSWLLILGLYVAPHITKAPLDMAQALPAVAMFFITATRLAFVSGFEAFGAKAVAKDVTEAYPFLDRTEEGHIFHVLDVLAKEDTTAGHVADDDTGTRSSADVMEERARKLFTVQVPLVLRCLVVLAHGMIPMWNSAMPFGQWSWQQSLFGCTAALVSMTTFNRLLYLSEHVQSAQHIAVERMKAFGILTSPDDYYRKRKSYNKDDGVDFPPFLNLRDPKDIMRWCRTRELLLKIGDSHDKRRHDTHLGLVLAVTLSMCVVLVLMRLVPSLFPASTPKYLLGLLLLDVCVLSWVVIITLWKAAQAYSIQKDHLRILQQEHFHLTLLYKQAVRANAPGLEALQDASDLLEHTQSYLEKCDILPTLIGFEVNETFLQTVVTVLCTTIATGASSSLGV